MGSYKEHAITIKLLLEHQSFDDRISPRKLGRSLAQEIVDAPEVFSGIAEQCLVDAEGYLLTKSQLKKHDLKICSDHRHSRQKAGEDLATEYRMGWRPSVDELEELLKSYLCVVNYVRRETNNALSAIQNGKGKYRDLSTKDASWEVQYGLLDAKWVQVKGKRSKYVYFIEGEYYGNREEAQAAYPGVDVDGRCEAKKWSNWTRVKYEEYIK